MSKIIKQLFTIALLIITCIFLLRFCDKKEVIITKEKVDTLFLTKTIIVTDTVYSEKLKPSDSVYIVIEKDIVIDTAKILEIFFTKYKYDYEYKDSIIKVLIQDTIYKNKIYSRVFHYDLKNKETIVTIEKEKVIKEGSFKILIGGHISSFDGKNFILRPSVSYQDKKDNIFSISYGIPDKSIMIGYQKPIKIKK